MSTLTDLDKLIQLAGTNANIVAIGTEGSLNDRAKRQDEWSDLDVTLFVRVPALEDGWWWIRQLGEPTIVQFLETQDLFGAHTGKWRSWLTRYAGTRRVDFKITSYQVEGAYLAHDTLNTIVWRENSGRVLPRKTSAQSHFIPLPDQDSFQEHVREFYWYAGNVVKGLARQNLVYANEQFNRYVRPELLTLLAMRATSQQKGQFDAGVTGKFIEPTLSAAEKAQLTATYQQTSLTATKASLRKALQLYRSVSEQISVNNNFDLPITITKVYQQFDRWLDV
jgi:hypothetical protein